MSLFSLNLSGALGHAGLAAGMAGTTEEFGAIGVHHTAVDKTGTWDAGANLKRLGDNPGETKLRAMHAWVDPGNNANTKAAYKEPHHNVSGDGKVGAANMKGVAAAMGRLNGGGLDIPAKDRKGVYDHLAAHYKDAGMEPPDFVERASADVQTQNEGLTIPGGEFFVKDPLSANDPNGPVEFQSGTANDEKGTIDCVWYGGATVPRVDRKTGKPYMLKLDMTGCRMDRLNAGAPIFDTHFTGDDFKSIVAGMVTGNTGTRAQRGVVQKAWRDGDKGKATLQFDIADPQGAELYRKAKTGIVRNLSFGTWIYALQPMESAAKTQSEGMPEGKPPNQNSDEIGMFTATDWEPFEISPVTIPADFTTQFLGAQPGPQADAIRAASPQQENPVETLTPGQTGGEARPNEQQLAAARDEGAQAERKRVADIQALSTPMAKYGIDEKFVQGLITGGKTVDQARTEIFNRMAEQGMRNSNGQWYDIHTETGASVTRDGAETRLRQMQSALLLRFEPDFFLKKHEGGLRKGQFVRGNGIEEQKQAEEQAREYRSFSLLEMARESLHLRGVNTRGMNKNQIAEMALGVPMQSRYFFDGGAESTSDFPGILANVANKTLRQAYEAYPRTFQPFCRQVTAADFKPINRAQLSDAPALQALNERGEFHRANLSDLNSQYQLATFGEVVALSRKVIINDDLQAFTRVPAILGVAAARLESDKVWAVITGNQVMTYDSTALFHANHANLETGAGSAVGISALSQARAQMRLQTAPQGTPLNLTPRFILGPTALETAILQLIYPLQLAATAVTGVVPEWVMSLVPVIEPRLDANSGTAWYLVSDSAVIDTIEYCYLEGQQGVYIETRQGFEVDGVEVKARMDFAAAAIDHRGLQKNAGA